MFQSADILQNFHIASLILTMALGIVSRFAAGIWDSDLNDFFMNTNLVRALTASVTFPHLPQLEDFGSHELAHDPDDWDCREEVCGVLEE